MSDAGPSECLPTVQNCRPIEWLGWQSPRRFSFVCRLLTPGSEMDFRDKAIVFSLCPPNDRSRRDKPCSGDDKVRGRSTKQRRGFDSRPHRVRNHIRRKEAMKTASRENPNHEVAWPRNRAHGAVDQNRTRSIKRAEKQEKFQPKEMCFFLTSLFTELARYSSPCPL